jgi:type II secretory pathway pseudopilin PulG
LISRRLQIALLTLVVVIFGMSYYALKLKQHAERVDQVSQRARPALPAAAGPKEPVQVFVAYDEDLTLRPRQVQAAKATQADERARAALRALIDFYTDKQSPHPLGQGSDINAVYLANETTAVVDLNSTFANTHRSGIMEEELTIVSVIQTLAANLPKLTRVKFLVDGKERDTLAGHSDLKGFYDVATIAQIARELQ